MADKLSLPNLLSLLEVSTDTSTVGIQRLCADAEALRRRGRRSKAIETAQQAARLSHAAYNPHLHGIAQLYLSLSRLSSQAPNEESQAIRDCEYAITSFHLDPHNYVIALIFRAQIDREIELRADDELEKERWRREALKHFQEASDALRDRIGYLQAHAQQTKSTDYEELCDAVQKSIDGLSDALTRVEPIAVSEKQRRPRWMPAGRVRAAVPPRQAAPRRVAGEPPIDLGHPTRIEWPAPDNAERLIVPLDAPFVIVHSSQGVLDASGRSGEDVEIRQFAIANRLYTMRLIAPRSELPKLQLGRPYIVATVAPNGEKLLRDDEYALVRLGDGQPRSGDKVLVDDAPAKGKRKRHWIIRDSGPDMYISQDIRIIGMVEAVLTPMTTMSEGLGDLLASVDDLRMAESYDPKIGEGIAAIRRKMQQTLAQLYDLEAMPITPGQTPYDPIQGHYAVDFESDPAFPDGVILKVVADGYRQRGQIVRDAKVIVNRLS